MSPFEVAQRALRELTRVSPYNYMVMRDKIGLYFQNTLIARFTDGGDALVVEFTDATPKDSREAIENFLSARHIPFQRTPAPSA